MKQIKMRHQYNHSDLDAIYCPDNDFSLDRALRDSFDSLPISNEDKKYSFLVHKWGVDTDIHKSNEILDIVLDHLLEDDEKLTRLPNSLDIRHIDDPLSDPGLQSDDENKTVTDERRFQIWLVNTQDITEKRNSSKLKMPLIEPTKNSPAAKKTKIIESVPHELTPTRKPTSTSPTNSQATGPSCNTTNIADTTGAAADETTPVNNDSVNWDRVIDRVFHEHCSFMT